jgi:hypothetical protein
MKTKIDEGKGKSAEIKKENQMKSEELEKSYQSFKKCELKLKEDELDCEKIREELEGLVKVRQEVKHCLFSGRKSHRFTN